MIINLTGKTATLWNGRNINPPHFDTLTMQFIPFLKFSIKILKIFQSQIIKLTSIDEFSHGPRSSQHPRID